MSQLPGFSKYMKFSEIEVDQPFETSMQQLNSSQAYYVFPENARIMNAKGQVLEWKDSVDEYLYPIDANTLQNKDGVEYTVYRSDYSHDNDGVILTVTSVMNWDYTTQFINVQTGEIYNHIYISDVTIPDTEGSFKLPTNSDGNPGADLFISQLNCTLDISKTKIVSFYLDYFGEPTNTGKILINESQRNWMSDRIQDVSGVLWLDGKIRVEVVQT